MLKKSFIILLLLITLPAFSAYNPLSDEPIESVEQFYSDDEEELLENAQVRRHDDGFFIEEQRINAFCI